MLFTVNGTLMRGLELNQTLVEAGASFLCEIHTAPIYRLWSIGDRYPGMIRDSNAGAAIGMELWDIDPTRLSYVLESEPPGLTVGWVQLEDGRKVLGILAEPWITEGMPEITGFGDWHTYLASLAHAP